MESKKLRTVHARNFLFGQKILRLALLAQDDTDTGNYVCIFPAKSPILFYIVSVEKTLVF